MIFKHLALNIALIVALNHSVANSDRLENKLENKLPDFEFTYRDIMPMKYETQLTTDTVADMNNSIYDKLRNSDDEFRITDEHATIITKIDGLKQIYKESRFVTDAISPTGAKGIGQQFKAAWESVGEGDKYNSFITDATYSIKVMYKYNVWILKFLEQNHPRWKELSIEDKRSLMLAGYNQGVGTLQDAGYNINKLNSEGRNYVNLYEVPIIVTEDHFNETQKDFRKYLKTMQDLDRKLNPSYAIR